MTKVYLFGSCARGEVRSTSDLDLAIVTEKYLKGCLDKYLTDFYFDARDPRDDFYTVTKEEFEKCMEIMYDTLEKLKTWMGTEFLSK